LEVVVAIWVQPDGGVGAEEVVLLIAKLAIIRSPGATPLGLLMVSDVPVETLAVVGLPRSWMVELTTMDGLEKIAVVVPAPFLLPVVKV
jgi:uncharacterized membrane protein YkgB